MRSHIPGASSIPKSERDARSLSDIIPARSPPFGNAPSFAPRIMRNPHLIPSARGISDTVTQSIDAGIVESDSADATSLNREYSSSTEISSSPTLFPILSITSHKIPVSASYSCAVAKRPSVSAIYAYAEILRTRFISFINS